MLKDLDKDTVSWEPNFDETLKELREALAESDKEDAEYIESNQDNTRNIDRLAAKREKKLEKMNIEKTGDFIHVSYDSPYKFYNRRNEVIIKVNY